MIANSPKWYPTTLNLKPYAFNPKPLHTIRNLSTQLLGPLDPSGYCKGTLTLVKPVCGAPAIFRAKPKPQAVLAALEIPECGVVWVKGL